MNTTKQNIEELSVKDPDMMHNYFYVCKEGPGFQTWESSLLDGDPVTFYLESEDKWMDGTVASWYIDDASGNAPGANAHFYIKVSIGSKNYKLDLYDGLRVKLNVPTDDELRNRVKQCQEMVTLLEETRYNPAEYGSCLNEGKLYVAPSGYESWYCDEHKPSWAMKG